MKICKEGIPFVLASFLVTLSFWGVARYYQSAVFGIACGLGVLATAFCAYFFRDPKRVIAGGKDSILSPADGKIVEISEGKDPSWNEPVWILRIFLSVFEPHLQRSPFPGKVQRIRYTKGRFLDARHPQAHFENEQNRIEVASTHPKLKGPIVVTQIAGLIARRIICSVQEGQEIQAGDKIGLIRFGSQVDLVIPKSAKLHVETGRHVTAGDTVIAEL